jgi:serine/threonine protein phosphatase PrpC
MMLLHLNGELIYQSEEHFWKNPKEKERLGNSVTYDKSSNIKVVSEKDIVAVYSEYVRMKNGNQLALTQAVGHNNCVRPAPDVFRVEVGPMDEIVAVCFSDGVTDMFIHDREDNICKEDIQMVYELSAEDLKNTIQARWLQPWNMTNMLGKTVKDCSYTKDQCDDVGVARFVMKPKN